MHVHYVTLPETYFNPVKLTIEGQEHEVVSPSVSDYLKYASINNRFQLNEITEDEMAAQTVAIFLPFVDTSVLHPIMIQNLFALCMSTFNTEEQKVFYFNDKEFDFSKKEDKKEEVAAEGTLEYIKQQVNKNKSSYIYIDLIKQITSLVKFYGFSHKEIMEMPYIWFINYLIYKGKLEAEEDMRNLYIAAASQSTDCKKVMERLRIAARLDCDIMNEMSNAK